MTKKERIQAVLRGERPDKLPYSFWTHMPGTDLDPVAISEKTWEFYQKYDLDFIKTMNNGMYAAESFGAVIDYSEIPKGGVARVVSTPIHSAEDMKNIRYCPPTEGVNARELEHLRLVLEKFKGEDVPVIFTVFSPITILDKLIGGEMGTIRAGYIEQGKGSDMHAALEEITRTTEDLARAAIALGADGIFLGAQLCTYDLFTTEQYREFGMPYDIRVLEAASGGWMNTMHSHGNNIIFELLKDYPVAFLNYHIWETAPDPDEAHALMGKCLMGGIARFDITKRNRPAVQNEIFKCFKQMRGTNMVLTPGCVVRYPLDEEMLHFVGRTRDAVQAAFDAGKILP